MKDRFSGHAADYARHRPRYPAELVQWLVSLCSERRHAWDCGTGNGQLALALSPYFDRIDATDISAQQLQQAPPTDGVYYSVRPAEDSGLAPNSIDLITAAQAAHWFDMEQFNREALRVLKPRGILALIGYNRPMVSPEVDAIAQDFYTNVVGPYWDPERRLVDERYTTIDFPFPDLDVPRFEIAVDWDVDDYLAYLRTWSATKRYLADRHLDPVSTIEDALRSAWPLASRENATIAQVIFPLHLRVGRKDSWAAV